MTSEAKQKIQLVLAVVIAAAALRAGYVVYERLPDEPRSRDSRRRP